MDTDEPRLYARTLVSLTPDNPEDGPGIPAGEIVEIIEQPDGSQGSGLTARWNDVCMDVRLDQIDPDC